MTPTDVAVLFKKNLRSMLIALSPSDAALICQPAIVLLADSDPGSVGAMTSCFELFVYVAQTDVDY
jgi:hypothetical protein